MRIYASFENIRTSNVSDRFLFHKIQEITQTIDIVRNDETSYEDVRYGFGTPKGHTFSL